jgi:four helix bundle protein
MGSASVVSFRDLDAWNIAMDLSVMAYELVKLLPSTEKFELSSQIRRASVSIPSNVAEGHASGTPGRCIHHLRISLGSLGELETDLELGKRLGFFTVDQLKQANRQIERTGRLLHGLLRAKKIQRLKSVGSTLALFVGPALGLLLLSVLH